MQFLTGQLWGITALSSFLRALERHRGQEHKFDLNPSRSESQSLAGCQLWANTLTTLSLRFFMYWKWRQKYLPQRPVMRIKQGNACNALSIVSMYSKCPINKIRYDFCNEKNFIRKRIFGIEAVMALLEYSTLTQLLEIQTVVAEFSLKHWS